MSASTPALAALSTTAHRVLRYRAGSDHFGEHAVQQLGLDPASVAKTLVVAHGRDLGVCVIPVPARLSLKKAAAALGWKSCDMAAPAHAQRATGYVVGGISPLGLKSPLPVLIDDSLAALETVCVSAGKRGVSVLVAPTDLAQLTGARCVPLTA